MKESVVYASQANSFESHYIGSYKSNEFNIKDLQEEIKNSSSYYSEKKDQTAFYKFLKTTFQKLFYEKKKALYIQNSLYIP